MRDLIKTEYADTCLTLRSIRNIPQKSRMLLAGLVTNYREGGGLQNGRGDVKFYPYEKGGGSFGVVFPYICIVNTFARVTVHM